MRNTVLILLISAFQVFATGSYAQTKKISLAMNDAAIRDVLYAIQKQSEFYFLYNSELIDVTKKVDITIEEEKVDQVLTRLFNKNEVDFLIKDRYIVLTPVGGNAELFAEQQQPAVSGKVTDESGQPLPGVTIVIKGTTRGTVTNADGEYNLTNLPEDATLQFSFVGMRTEEVEVGTQNSINVEMVIDAIGIEEVVAIGYGTQKRSNLTGAISSVRTDDLPKVANISVTQMLSGKASGVNVRQVSAQPGGGIEILIRGAGSLNAGNEPLYVIDGFPVNNNSVEPGSGDRYSYGSRNPLNSINPNDIESIEILKDASSTAIYGARAANGVVLITTKKGKAGRTNIEVSGSHSIQNISRYFDMLNATEFMIQSNRFGKEYYLINNSIFPYGEKDPGLASEYVPIYSQQQIDNAGEGTDWWDLVTQTGSISEFNLSINGGNDKTTFNISSNYFTQKGVAINSDLDRFTGRINLEHKVSDKLKIGTFLTGSLVDNRNIQLGQSVWENSGVLVGALQQSPLVPVYDAYGNYALNPLYAVLPNPVSYREIDDQTLNKRLLLNSYAELQILKGLKARVTGGVDDKTGKRSNYMPKSFLFGKQQLGKGYKELNNSTDLLFNSTLNYDLNVSSNHQLNILLGYEYQLFNGDGFGTGNNIFFTDAFGPNNLGAGEGRPTTGSYKYKNQLASYFSRLQYNYREKYLMTFTVRRDGSTNFGANNKWGTFPSVAVAWRITEEQFLKPVEFLSNLKMRISYGQTGNSNIGNNAFEYYGTRGNYLFGNSVQKAVGKTQVANPELKWETTNEMNIGLDFGLFNNRIAGTFEYFNKKVDDLLAYRQLPTYSDLPGVADNIGSTRLSGLEFNIETRNIDRQLKWTTNFNVSAYKDRWEKRSQDVILNPWQSEDDPIRAIYGYRWDGIAQIGEDIPHMPNANPGNIILKDLNGFDEDNQLTGEPDGKINEADIVLLGSSDPGLFFGIGNTLIYKGFDLNFFFYGMADRILSNSNAGKYLYDASRLITMGHNQMTDISKLFTADNPSNEYPGIAPSPIGGLSDFWLERADFIRLKNVTLGYSLPSRIFQNKFEARIYFDAQNLFLWTDYSGVDPETDSLGAYPNQKSYSVGINLKF